MEAIMYDTIDGDHDLQIVQRTVDHAMDIDMKGYMTYHTGDLIPSTSSYNYATYMMQGIKAHGLDFQPWIGWFYPPKNPGDPPVIDDPFVYQQVLEQFKIAKSFGVKEIVIAPSRLFFNGNTSAAIERLQDLLDIKENGFETFRIPILHNMRFFNNFPLWLEKIHPNVWIAMPAIFEDMMMGTPYQIFLISHILVSVAGGVAIFYLLKKLDPNLRE